MLTYTIDHIEPFAPSLEHVAHDLRGILQVSVHDDDCIPFRVVHACSDGELVTKVARERQELEAWLRLADCIKQLVGAILRAIVDEDHLPGHSNLREELSQPTV